LAVEVPDHGFLTAAGNDWKCERGYRSTGSSCVRLDLPENAHIDYSGGDWECDRGFQREGEGCVTN
jgi:hypothetical protein